MDVQHKLVTLAEFEAFIQLPENADRIFELIDGEIVEKMPSNPLSSHLATQIIIPIGNYLATNDIGYLTTEAGGYKVFGNTYVPDVGFILKSRLPDLPYEGFAPMPPDLAVEVVSPSDSEKELMHKVADYLAAGVLVWVLYPKEKEVKVFAPGQPVQTLDINGVLDGGKVLPGFTLPVKNIFR
jgi:Uma2 family endonuclease